MYKVLTQKLLPALLVAATLIIAGCMGSNVKTDYYTLRALTNTAPHIKPIANLSDYTLALGPVSLPVFITSRAQIMAVEGSNKLVMIGNARWAEPLDTNMLLVLTDNLTYLLNLGNVIQYPWRASAVYDLKLEMTVFDFTADKDTARLRAHYTITYIKTGKILEREINLTSKVNAFTAAEVVSAQNWLLDEASVEIAQSVAGIIH